MADAVHRMLAAVVIAIGLAALLGWRSLHEPDPRRTTSVKASAASPELTDLMPYSQPLTDTVIPGGPPQAIVLARDPFVPPGLPRFPGNSRLTGIAAPERSATSRGLRVTATMIAGTRRAAVINDDLIYVGDPVPGGGTLKSVERDRVIVVDPAGTSHVVAVNEGADR